MRKKGEFVVGPGAQREDPGLGEGRDRARSVRLSGVDARILADERDGEPEPKGEDDHRCDGQRQVPCAVESPAQPSLGKNEDDEQGDEGQDGHDRQERGDSLRLIVSEPPALGPVDIRRRRQDRRAHEVVRLGDVRRRQRVGPLALVEVGVLDDAGVDR